MLNLDDDETVTQILPVDEFADDKYIFMATRNGTVKKTSLNMFAKKYKSGIKAINIDENDKLVGSLITDGKQEMLLASNSGKLIRFHESKVRPMGRTARGVRGLKINKNQKIILSKDRRTANIHNNKQIKTFASYSLVKTMRGSILVLGPLVSKYYQAKISLPGGCLIGARPINYHLDSLKKLGMNYLLKDGYNREFVVCGTRHIVTGKNCLLV